VDVSQQKIGAIFLQQAAIFKKLLFTYSANHPHAVALISKKRLIFFASSIQLHYRASLEKTLKTEGLEIKELISGLSLVFRHTEKYSTILQEVERNTPNAHADRGNLQRACSVYRDIAVGFVSGFKLYLFIFKEDCLALRKQKETQLEFLNSGCMEKTTGKTYAQKLGTLMHISSVTVTFPNAEDEDALLDRCFVLFANSCLFFEVSIEKSTYLLKEQFSVKELTVKHDENALKLTFSKGMWLLLT
jgi:hypothetical protein